MRWYKSIRTKITKKVCRELTYLINIVHNSPNIFGPYSVFISTNWDNSMHFLKFNFFKNYNVFLYLTDRIET